MLRRTCSGSDGIWTRPGATRNCTAAILVEVVHDADRELVTPEHIRRFSVTGTAPELAERVHGLAADGVAELALQPGGDVADELRRLAAAFVSAGLLRSPDGA